MAKFFYFAQRNPTMPVAAFPARWRQHAALAMTMRSWDNKLLYVQANALHALPDIAVDPVYDGFCYGLTESQGLLQAATPQDEADARTLVTDELVAFEGPILPRVMLFDEDVLLAGGFGVVALLAFQDVDLAKTVAEGFAVRPGLERVIFNRVQGNVRRDVVAADFAVIVEICAGDEERLLAALRANEALGWREAATIVVAKENILWDRRPSRTSDQ